MMRTFIFLCCTTVFSLAPRHAGSQNEKIMIHADQELTVNAVFDMIIAQTDYSVIYHENQFKDVPKVQLKKGVIRLEALLNRSLSTANLNVIFAKNNTIIIKKVKPMQQRKVTGTVIDQSDLPIPGAAVLIKGTNRGATTNLEGQYSITVPDPANVLVFTSLGFKPQEIIVGSQTTINVSLKEDISQLDEVVIKGYYKTSRKYDTGNVSSIKAETIEKQPVSNPIVAIQGYIPGVNITRDSGMPGGGFSIEIRGRNFIGNNTGDAFNITQPLYIVDGVPYSSQSFGDLRDVDSFSSFAGGKANISPLNLIEPSNIESIEVLKDADATAIYGSRGANGVVLITTKKGKMGKTQIKVNVTTGLASVIGFADLLNTRQYLELRLEALANDGYTLEAPPTGFIESNPDLYVWDQDRYTDWQKELIGGTAYRNTAQLSVSGGREQTQFLFSGAWQNETTVFPGDSKYRKASVHSSINHQSMDERFTINTTIDYVADDKFLPSANFSLLSRQLAPNAPALYNENGDLNWENGTWDNPLAALERKFRQQSNNLLMNTMLSYRLTLALEFKTSLGYTDYRMELYNTHPHTVSNPDKELTSEDSFVQTSNASSQSWIAEPQMNWKKDWSKASLDILIGATFQHRESNSISHIAFNFPSNNQILNLAAADVIEVTSDDDSEYNYQSVFGRLNFSWDKKYIINLTGRRDGSSRFGPGRQFGNFWAVGAAWVFLEEDVTEANDLLSFGKFRTSYGITGSDNIGDYGFYDSYSNSSGQYDGSGLRSTGLFNPFYAWEENKKFEAALDLVFFQGDLMLTAAWYKNRSSNQLVGIPLPGTTGFPSVNANFDATVQNTGLEVDFRSKNIQNEHFKWTSTFNISVPKNKLVKFDNLEASTFANLYVVGQPLSIIKTFHSLGVNPDTGVREFEDYNGDGIIDINSYDDRQWVEDIGPKFYGGFGNTFNYNNWTLDAFFEYKQHRQRNTLVSRIGGFGNTNISALDRWQQIGDQTRIGKATLNLSNDFGSNLLGSDGYESTFFARLRNISLTYTLPKSYSRGMDISIYLQGQNLLTFTKYKGVDPNSFTTNNQLPILKQVTLGLNFGF